MNTKARVIAFYLPQFHPIPENDKWWGKGFTEWTNVGRAKKLFKGHYQPRVPADLGYYDLRVAETRKAQADMAREYGVEGFCYWHYWFNGKRLIERPFNEVVASGEPDFPFCLAWANETWKGFEHGLTNRNILMEQTYPGIEDYTTHFYEILPSLKDKRYIKVEEKPLFMLYKPLDVPDTKVFIDLWQSLALQNGLKGIYFVGHIVGTSDIDAVLNSGYDAVHVVRLHEHLSKTDLLRKIVRRFKKVILNVPRMTSYKYAMKFFNGVEDKRENVFPGIFPNWDHSPRSKREAIILHNSTPEYFKEHVEKSVMSVQDKPEDKRVIFLKSWNEWAEGNYMEPDTKYGLKYLEALKEVVKK